MADETDKPEVKGQDLTVKISDMPHVRSAQHVTVYANFAQCGLSPWDIRIVFSDVGESEPDVPAIIERATVILPPQVANALIAVLQQNVKVYAEQMLAAQAEAEARKKAAEESKEAQGEVATIDATEKPLAG